MSHTPRYSRAFLVILALAFGLLSGPLRAAGETAAEKKKSDGQVLLEALAQGVANAVEQQKKVEELSTKATAAVGKSQFAEALALADEALKLDPRHEGALVERGRALRGLGRTDEAIAHFEKSVARFPKNARMYTYLGGTYERAGQPAKALAALQTAARLDPKNSAGLTNQVSVFFALGDFAGAEAVCQAALALDPKSATTHRYLGATYLKMGRTEEGIAELEVCLRLNPGDKLAQSALEAGRNLQQVRAEASAATMNEGAPPVTAKKAEPAKPVAVATKAPTLAQPTGKSPAPTAAKAPAGASTPKALVRETASTAKPTTDAKAKAPTPAAPVADDARKKPSAKSPSLAEAKTEKPSVPKAEANPKPAAKASVPAKVALEPVPEIPAPATGYYKLVKIEMPLQSIPQSIEGEYYEVTYGAKSPASTYTSRFKVNGSDLVRTDLQWSFPDKLVPGVPLKFRMNGSVVSSYPILFCHYRLVVGGGRDWILGGVRICTNKSRTGAAIPIVASDTFELVIPEIVNRWWLGIEAERNQQEGPVATVRIRNQAIREIVCESSVHGDWISGDDPRTPSQLPIEEVPLRLRDWAMVNEQSRLGPMDIAVEIYKSSPNAETVATYTYRWDGPPPADVSLADRGPIEIKTDPAGRKELRADKRDGVWIWARAKAEQGVTASRVPALTQDIAFAAAGAGNEWVDLSQPKLSGGWKQIYVQASNPNPTSGGGDPAPATLSVTASVQDGAKRYAKTLQLAVAPDAKLDAQPDLIELSAQSGQTAQVKVAIESPGAERWAFRTEYDKADRALAKADIKSSDGKSALLNLKEAGLEPRRTGGSDERATLKIFAEQKGREPLERHIRLLVAQEGLFVDAQGRDPSTRQFKLYADGKGTPLEIDFRVFAQDPKTKRILNLTRNAGVFKDVKVECLEPKGSFTGRLLEAGKFEQELAGIRSSNEPAGIVRFSLAKELPSDGRVVPCDFRITYSGGKDAAFSALVTVGLVTSSNGPGGKDWKIELARCQEVIDKFVPAAYAAKMQAMLDRRKMTLGADGLLQLRKKIWSAAAELTLGEGGQGYADEAKWAGRITEFLEWSQWAGDMAFGAVIGNFVGPYGAMATTTLKGVVISAINAYQEGQSADAWLWENLYTIPGLLEGKVIDRDMFEKWGVQSKAKAWALYVGYFFLKNLWDGQSVIEALQNTAKGIGNEVLAGWLSGEVQKHGNRSVSGWAGDKAKEAGDKVKAVGQVVASGVAIAEKPATPDNPPDKPRIAPTNEPEADAVARIRRRTGVGTDDRPYAHTDDVLTVMKDPSMVRALKNAPPEVQDAFTNTRELIYWQHDVEVVQHVKDTVPGMKGRSVRVMEFRTPGATGKTINTDRDYRVCYLAGKNPKTGQEQWIEVPREKWEGKSYESFARVTGGPTDDPKASREWAERHQQLATDKGHAEASAAFSDQKRVFNKQTRQYETIQVTSNFERITKNREGIDVEDPQSLGRMYQLKVADARFPHEAFVQANKAVNALRDLRTNYENQGRNIGQMPERMRAGMEAIEKVTARLKADPNCRDPVAIAEAEKALRAQGFPNLEDFMNKLGSQIESFKGM